MAVQGKPTRLEEDQVRERVGKLDGWKHDGDSIARTWKFKDFREAKAFVDRVAEAANAADHHPDIHLENFNTVRLVLSTHSVGGLSQNDFDMAERIDRL